MLEVSDPKKVTKLALQILEFMFADDDITRSDAMAIGLMICIFSAKSVVDAMIESDQINADVAIKVCTEDLRETFTVLLGALSLLIQNPQLGEMAKTNSSAVKEMLQNILGGMN